MLNTCLFVCSGNYYRSRYAEIFFNQCAAAANLGWSASSRGTVVNTTSTNVGPLSVEVIKALNLKGSEQPELNRYPMQLLEQDLIEAALIIGLHEPEHRPYFEKHYGGYLKKVAFWQVPDIDVLPPEKAFFQIEQQVRDVIHRFSST